MALPGLGVIGAGVDLGKSIVSVFESHPKDKERLADNATAYSRASSGQAGWREWLKGRSGVFGSVVVPVSLPALSYAPAIPAGSKIGGWATAKTRDDAYAKFQAIEARFAALGGGQNATPKQAGNNPVGQPREGSSGDVGPSLASVVPQEALTAVTTFAPYILLGITLLWAAKYAKKWR